jgi:hypothetical protein
VRRAGPVLAAALVALANALALLGVARNRAGEPEAELRLSERELPLAPWSDENTGAFLQLRWQRALPGSKVDLPWFDRAKLESLGFDCSYPAEGKGAQERYGRMAARPAYVVLEYDGEAWRRWLQADEAEPRKPRSESKPPQTPIEEARVSGSRLVPIDVGNDASALRGLYPDRAHCLIVAGIVAPRWAVLKEDAEGHAIQAVVAGRIRSLLVSEVHVPRDLATPLAAVRDADAAAARTVRPRERPREGPPDAPVHSSPPRYEVVLRVGAHHEPWVAALRPLALP